MDFAQILEHASTKWEGITQDTELLVIARGNTVLVDVPDGSQIECKLDEYAILDGDGDPTGEVVYWAYMEEQDILVYRL